MKTIDKILEKENVVKGLMSAAILGGLSILGYGCGQVAGVENPYQEATTFLEQSGYKDVDYQGSNHFMVSFSGCDRSDLVEHVYEATAPNGDKDVDISVCAGIFKGMTIRKP